MVLCCERPGGKMLRVCPLDFLILSYIIRPAEDQGEAAKLAYKTQLDSTFQACTSGFYENSQGVSFTEKPSSGGESSEE